MRSRISRIVGRAWLDVCGRNAKFHGRLSYLAFGDVGLLRSATALSRTYRGRYLSTGWTGASAIPLRKAFWSVRLRPDGKPGRKRIRAKPAARILRAVYFLTWPAVGVKSTPRNASPDPVPICFTMPTVWAIVMSR